MIVLVLEAQWEIWLVNVMAVVSVLRPPTETTNYPLLHASAPLFYASLWLVFWYKSSVNAYAKSRVAIARPARYPLENRELSETNNKLFSTNNRNYNQSLLPRMRKKTVWLMVCILSHNVETSCYSWLSLSSHGSGADLTQHHDPPFYINGCLF